MQTVIQNPAAALRDRLSSLSPRGFVRWDISGRALLVTDAPRRQSPEELISALSDEKTSLLLENGLLYLDLSDTAYQELLFLPETDALPLHPVFFQEQLLLSRILAHCAEGHQADPSLLRRCLLSTVLPSPDFFLFLKELRSVFAASLREKKLASCRACAILCMQRLSEEMNKAQKK